jgi:hypothetical protein
VPSPDTAAAAYLKAAESGDEKSLRSMMTRRAQAAVSDEELARLLTRDHREFVARRKTFAPGQWAEREAKATFYLQEGQTMSLQLEDHQFRIEETPGILSRPRTPIAAATQLRRALAARDYHQIMGLLDAEAQASFREVFERLERTLGQIDTAVVEVGEDRASIEFEDGRVMRLRRDEKTWRVVEIE